MKGNRSLRSGGRSGRVAFCAFGIVALSGQAWAQVGFREAPIRYASAPSLDPVVRLQERINSGAARLEFDERHGYLKSVLGQLDVPISSQTLVFSKTSLQYPKIGPKAPRALYYNDEVYVGWVRDGQFLEVAAVDPRLGPLFYTLDQEATDRPEFVRNDQNCLQCHVSARTQGVPGILLRSVFANPSGSPSGSLRGFTTGHETPFEQRWGGWYVTGTHGRQLHMGNVVIADKAHPDRLDREAGANLTDLSDRFDTGAYLAKHSDIVAQLVLAHQAGFQNRLTRAGYLGQVAASGGPADGLEAAVEELLEYLLFTEEVALAGPIAGTSPFAEEFSRRGPRDSQGRSLRDFDLERRLFRYPCSYLIGSEAIDALPGPAKARFFERLDAILTGRDDSPAFAHITPEDRRAVRAILIETRPGLADLGRTPARDGGARTTPGLGTGPDRRPAPARVAAPRCDRG